MEEKVVKKAISIKKKQAVKESSSSSSSPSKGSKKSPAGKPRGRPPKGKVWDATINGFVNKEKEKGTDQASSNETFVGRKVVKDIDGETFRGEVTEEVRNVTTVHGMGISSTMTPTIIAHAP